MSARLLALILIVFDTVAVAMTALSLFGATPDPATRGLDNAAGIAVALLYAVTALPALFLVSYRRAPRAALVLALAFPGVFVIMFLTATIAYL